VRPMDPACIDGQTRVHSCKWCSHCCHSMNRKETFFWTITPQTHEAQPWTNQPMCSNPQLYSRSWRCHADGPTDHTTITSTSSVLKSHRFSPTTAVKRDLVPFTP
jgi:hypothetical protein